MKDKQKIVISVIMRTHNSEKTISKALDSLLHQNLSTDLYEILIIDDGSTDTTLDVLREYGHKIRLVAKKRTGYIDSANIGITKSGGQYVILLDSDDYFEPSLLRELLNAIEKNGVDFVYCDYCEKNGSDGTVRKISLKDDIFKSVASGILFKRELLEKAGGYDEKFIFPEYDLLIKLIRSGCKSRHVPEALFTYVRHVGSVTADQDRVKQGLRQLFDKYGEIEGLRLY